MEIELNSKLGNLDRKSKFDNAELIPDKSNGLLGYKSYAEKYASKIEKDFPSKVTYDELNKLRSTSVQTKAFATEHNYRVLSKNYTPSFNQNTRAASVNKQSPPREINRNYQLTI